MLCDFAIINMPTQVRPFTLINVANITWRTMIILVHIDFNPNYLTHAIIESRVLYAQNHI